MKQIRSITQTIEYLKRMDPETAITESALRRLVRENQIKSTRIGTKILIALEDVMSFFEV